MTGPALPDQAMKASPMIRLLPPACLALLLAFHSLAHADEAIATDRPDFVESSDVVAAGRVQLEVALNLERDRSGGLKSRVRSTPALLRFGLGHNLEARIETDGLASARVTDMATGITSRASGATDISLGLKWHMGDGDEKTGTPSTAWLLHVDLDSGAAAFRGEGKRPSLRFVAEWELPGETSIGVMPGLARDTDLNGKPFTAGILAVTAGTELAAHWRGFIELAGQRLASKTRGGNVVTFDTGVTYQINNDMQVDLSLQRGLTRFTPDLSMGLGWSVRF